MQKRRKARGSENGKAKLLYADTLRSADQLYCGRFTMPDAFVSFVKGRKRIAVLNRLEFGRGERESAFDKVLPLEDWVAKAKRSTGRSQVGVEHVIAELASEYGIGEFTVPGDFPSSIAFKLLEIGLALDVSDGSLFPSRERKTDEELAHIREGNRCSAAGIRAAETALRNAKAKGSKLYLDNKLLTSERLRSIIEIACLEAGSLSMGTIAAGGDQACDPHCAGYGPLRPNELIVVDVFPRVSRTGYFGDMTRTFLKGRPSDAQASLVKAVRAAQKKALSMVATGVNGMAIHRKVVSMFEDFGYETRNDENGAVGFIHGTGHGLGLEIHELPRVSTVSYRLKKNSVTTIEPGLYYPGLGGCRIEDVVVVRDGGCEKLSSYRYSWVID